MNIFINVFAVLAVFFVFLFVLAYFMKKEHYVKCEIIINAPLQKVFNYIKLLKNQDEFNTHAMVSPDRKREFKGIDGTIGYIYSWTGDKNAGIGEKEIINIIDGKRIEAEIRFTKPMVANATITMETEFLSENKTKLTWSNAGILKYPINIMIPIMENSVAKGMKISLINLKSILEN
jgi:hypothetical protein